MVNISKFRNILLTIFLEFPVLLSVDCLLTLNFASGEYVLNDPNLKAEVVFEGLDEPTSMAFLGPDDILVLEREKGTVQRIVNGQMLERPLFDANVSQIDGMLGIAVINNVHNVYSTNNSTHVFLYYTEAKKEDSEEISEQLGNRVYRYELVNGKLINSKIILNLPAGPIHNAGVMLIGPDDHLYASNGEVGSVGYLKRDFTSNKALNYENGADPDGRAGILRVRQDGHPVGGILGNTSVLNLYYAYGIRNSFGMDFDPVSGKLWATENGPEFGDEINLVEPGFNSGWAAVQGTLPTSADSVLNTYPLPSGFVNFEGRGKYRPPEFVWDDTVGPTALKFLNSNKLGEEYKNTMFVGDVLGTVYNFKLTKDRTQLSLEGALADGRADNSDELEGAIIAQGFSTITDIEVGPDGCLYIVSMDEGRIYRIVSVPTEGNVSPPVTEKAESEGEYDYTAAVVEDED